MFEPAKFWSRGGTERSVALARRGDDEDFVLTSQKGGQLSVARLEAGLLELLDDLAV